MLPLSASPFIRLFVCVTSLNLMKSINSYYYYWFSSPVCHWLLLPVCLLPVCITWRSTHTRTHGSRQWQTLKGGCQIGNQIGLCCRFQPASQSVWQTGRDRWARWHLEHVNIWPFFCTPLLVVHLVHSVSLFYCLWMWLSFASNGISGAPAVFVDDRQAHWHSSGCISIRSNSNPSGKWCVSDSS